MDSVKNASLTNERTNGLNWIYRTLPALPGVQLPGEEAVVVVATAGWWYLNTHQCIILWESHNLPTDLKNDLGSLSNLPLARKMRPRELRNLPAVCKKRSRLQSLGAPVDLFWKRGVGVTSHRSHPPPLGSYLILTFMGQNCHRIQMRLFWITKYYIVIMLLLMLM